MTTSRPALASSSAAADPAGPPPTTTASTGTHLSGLAYAPPPPSPRLPPGPSPTPAGAPHRGGRGAAPERGSAVTHKPQPGRPVSAGRHQDGAAAPDPASLGQIHHSGLGLQHLDALGIPAGLRSSQG